MSPRRDALEEMSDLQLRQEAHQLGLPVGRSLGRDQLIELLLGVGDEPEREPEEASGAELPPAFSTVSMAKLLSRQGMDQQAAAVCREVLSRRPDEGRARLLLHRLVPSEQQRRRSISPRYRLVAQLVDPEDGPPVEPRHRPQPSVSSSVELMAQGPSVLFALWELAPAHDHRVAEVAGDGGCRVLRLFSAWRGAQGIDRHTRDLEVERRSSHLRVEGCPPGAVHRAAVGWLADDGRFFPLCQSEPTTTAPGRPFDERRALWVPSRTGVPEATDASAVRRLLERIEGASAILLPWEEGGWARRWPSPGGAVEVDLPPPPGGPSSPSSMIGGPRT